MATIKVKFRPSAAEGCEGSVYYQVIHERCTRQIVSGLRMMPQEWSDTGQETELSERRSRRPEIEVVERRIRFDTCRLRRIVGRFESEGMPYSVDDIVGEYRRLMRQCSLVTFMSELADGFRACGRFRTSETYRAALASFRQFLKHAHSRHLVADGDDVMLDSLDSGLMEHYERWLRSRGLVPNSVSFYMRILRAVYNRAVDRGDIDDRAPFRHVYTGVDKTRKRAITLNMIRKIMQLDLTSMSHELNFARDMFVMSFCLRGMSFIDMAYLKKTDLSNGYVTYRRRKTGQTLTIKWTREMQTILDRYPRNETDYLLPVIRRKGVNERNAYRNAGYRINHSLKTIAAMVGAGVPLTMYVARHSWASAARAKGIPLGVISEGMGHDSESTTRIYLASLDTTAVDNANNILLKALR